MHKKLLCIKNEWLDLLSKKQRRDTKESKGLLWKNKERLREHARDRYRNLSEEEKNGKRGYGKNRYHKMSEEKKQRLEEYQKIIARQEGLNIIMNKIVF